MSYLKILTSGYARVFVLIKYQSIDFFKANKHKMHKKYPAPFKIIYAAVVESTQKPALILQLQPDKASQ